MKVYKVIYKNTETGAESFDNYFRKFEDVYKEVYSKNIALNSKKELLSSISEMGIAFPEVDRTTQKYSGVSFYVHSIETIDVKW